jgi:branched-chain amino acid transport system permease protein
VPRDKTEVGLSQLRANSRTRAGVILGAIAIMFTLLFGASPAIAKAHTGDNTPTDFSISGTLLNADKPLVGVSITATGEKNFSQSVKSDKDGAWTIYVPAEAKYTVKLDLSTLPKGVALTNAADAVQTVDLAGLGFAGVGFDFGAATEHQQSFGEQLLIRVFSGLNFGLLLAIAAIGISLIYGTTGLNNFAHGEMVTLGAMLMWVFYTLLGWNILLAALVSIVIIAFSGFVQNQFLWKPLRKRRLGLNQMMIVSIGLSIVARYLMLIFFDGDTKDISGGGNPVTFGPIETTDVILVSMGLNLVALVGVALFLTRTRLGKATRAVSDNPSLAESSGIDVEKIIRTIWILAGALTGLSGVLYGLQFQANWELGYNILLLLFAAVTLGGLGTSLGATVGALIIGMVVEVSPLFIPNEMKYAVALVILILILLFRPQGVLGKKQRIG